MGDFYSARSGPIPPLPWSSFPPPFPPQGLATGVGGLEWRHVEPLVQAQLKGIPATVCLYAKYVAKQAAVEPLKAANAAR